MTAPVGTVDLNLFQNADQLTLKISGSTLYLERVLFGGSTQKAMEYLQEFCKQNTVIYKGHDRGYGTLTVNSEEYFITPYGINVKMMLEYCGDKTAADFPVN